MPLVRWYFFAVKKKTLRDSTEIPVQRLQDLNGFKSSMSTQATKVLDRRSAHCTKTQAHKFVRKALLGHVFLQGHHLSQAFLGYAWNVNCFSHIIPFHDNIMTFRNCLSLWQTGRKNHIKKGRVALEETWSSDDGGHAHRARTKQPRKVAKAFRRIRRYGWRGIWRFEHNVCGFFFTWLNSLNLPGSKNPISNLAKPSIHPKSAEPLQVLHDS